MVSLVLPWYSPWFLSDFWGVWGLIVRRLLHSSKFDNISFSVDRCQSQHIFNQTLSLQKYIGQDLRNTEIHVTVGKKYFFWEIWFTELEKYGFIHLSLWTNAKPNTSQPHSCQKQKTINCFWAQNNLGEIRARNLEISYIIFETYMNVNICAYIYVHICASIWMYIYICIYT